METSPAINPAIIQRGRWGLRIGWLCVVLGSICSVVTWRVILQDKSAAVYLLYGTQFCWFVMIIASIFVFIARRPGMGALLIIGGTALMFTVSFLAGFTLTVSRMTAAFNEPGGPDSPKSVPEVVKFSEAGQTLLRNAKQQACVLQEMGCTELCAAVRSVGERKDDARYVFVINSSQSMAEQGNLESAGFAIALAAELFPNLEFGIYSGTSSVKCWQSPGRTHDDLLQQLSTFTILKLDPLAAVVQGTTCFQRDQRKANMVMFTDYQSDPSEGERLASLTKDPFNSSSYIHLSASPDSYLQKLAAATDGKYVQSSGMCQSANALLSMLAEPSA